MLAKRMAPLLARAEEFRLPSAELDVHKLLGTARQQALLEDFGPGDFRPGLDLLVDSVNADVRPHRVGAQLLRELIGVQLRNRVGLRDWSKKNPDSRIEVIAAPIVLCGLPGSGIDLLAGLIGHDAGVRVPRVGEALVAAPPNGALPVSYRPDLRDPAVAAVAQRVGRLLGSAASSNEMQSIPDATHPAPDDLVLAGHFFSPLAASLIGATSYADWSLTADAKPAYDWQHSVLQALQACEPTSQWVLHGCVHLGQLAALLSVQPDARLVWVHRDPAATGAHEADLAARVRRLLVSDDGGAPASESGGDSASRIVSHLDQLDRADSAIKTAGAEVLHLHHVELNEDPVGTVARIYRRFDLDLPTAARWRMDAWIARRTHTRTVRSPTGEDRVPDIEDRRNAYLRRHEVFNEIPG